MHARLLEIHRAFPRMPPSENESEIKSVEVIRGLAHDDEGHLFVNKRV